MAHGPENGAISTKWSPRRAQPGELGVDLDDCPSFPDDDPIEVPPTSSSISVIGAAVSLNGGHLLQVKHPVVSGSTQGLRSPTAGADGEGTSEASLPMQVPLTKAQPAGHGVLKRIVGEKSPSPMMRQCHPLGEEIIVPVAHLQEVVLEGQPRRCTAANPFWEPLDARRVEQRSELGLGDIVVREVSSNGRLLLPMYDPDPSPGCSPAPTLKCMADAVHAVDGETELLVTDADLTMVHIQSWEQKLDWRSFLSEAVATGKAREIFRLFDVEAEPPSYLRPPPSSDARPSYDGRTFMQCRSGL